MNEKILAQFYVIEDEYEHMMETLKSEYGFELVGSCEELPSMGGWYVLFRGKMDSEAATALALKRPDIAGRMSVSYIPDTFKDKYRT